MSGTGPKAGGPHYLRRFRKTEASGDHPAEAPPVPLRVLRDNMPDAARGGWSRRPDRIAVLRKHLRGKGADALAAAGGLDFGPIDLPGPTGESDTLVLVPRGRVLCLGPDRDALLAQVIQALGAGNAVLAVAPGAAEALRPLTGKGLPLGVVEASIASDDLGALDIDAVAVSADEETMRTVRRALAAGEGPIVRLIATLINASAYVHEHAICVDTTAAGGNATLLAATA